AATLAMQTSKHQWIGHCSWHNYAIASSTRFKRPLGNALQIIHNWETYLVKLALQGSMSWRTNARNNEEERAGAQRAAQSGQADAEDDAALLRPHAQDVRGTRALGPFHRPATPRAASPPPGRAPGRPRT